MAQSQILQQIITNMENVIVGKNSVIGVEKNPKAEIVVLGRDITVGDGVRVLSGQKNEKDILV